MTSAAELRDQMLNRRTSSATEALAMRERNVDADMLNRQEMRERNVDADMLDRDRMTKGGGAGSHRCGGFAGRRDGPGRADGAAQLEEEFAGEGRRAED